MIMWGIDLLLGFAALATAGQALLLPGLFRAVANFMAFGLVMALIWVRLEAPDVALAEAAIGAGITGALLLTALAQLPEPIKHPKPQPCQRRKSVSLLITLLIIAVPTGYAIWHLPRPGLTPDITQVLPESGADHAVTAILLNLRGMDTLLEIAVMLSAVAVIWTLQRDIRPPILGTDYPSLPILVRWLHPLFLLMFAYLLWQGTHAPGGAFPAGAVLGAGGVMLLLANQIHWLHTERYKGTLRWMLIAGLLLFMATALTGIVTTGVLYGLPSAWASLIILAVELAASLSTALMLMTFYLLGRPGQ